MTSTRTQPWSPEEIELVTQLVGAYGEANWKRVSTDFNCRSLGPKRSCKQCRELWLNKLSPNVIKGEWSEAELQTLYQCHQRLGNAWSKMTEFLPGRTENAIKNTFYGSIRKALKAYNRTHKDQNRILRTIKSLIRDRQVTQLLNLVETSKEEAKEASSEDSTIDSHDETRVSVEAAFQEAPSVELTVPYQVMEAAILQQMWHCQQWLLALGYY